MNPEDPKHQSLRNSTLDDLKVSVAKSARSRARLALYGDMYAELEGEVEVDDKAESAPNKRKLDACNTESSTGGELHVPKITGHAAVDRLLQEAAEVRYIKDPMRAIIFKY